MIKYIIGHWTAGGYSPNNLDKKSYQLLVNAVGKVTYGLKVGNTASTGGMNSITYNIACCGGTDKCPIVPAQMESFCKIVANELKQRGLSVDKFYTHAEIGEMVRNYQTKHKGGNLKNADCSGKLITDLLPYNSYLPQNVGKVDLRKLPNKDKVLTSYSAKTSGDYLRGKIKWYMQNS